MISIIAPSRKRVKKSTETIHNWINSASDIHNIELIVSCDSSDDKLQDYKEVYSHTVFKNNPVIVNNNKSAVEAINNAARVATGDIFIVVSDDTESFSGWDAALLKEVQGKTDWILKTQDGIQKWIITFPVMDRTYYNRFGYIYHPDYLHMFCDTELTCVADITRRKITSNLLFPHKHYSITKETPDEINKKADATWAQGEKLFLERYKRNFDLQPGGRIQGQGMIDWLIKKQASV